MPENTVCNLCDSPETYSKSSEQRQVACHVRKFQNDNFTVWRCGGCQSLHSKEVVDLDSYYADYPLKKHTLDFHAKIGYRNRIKLLTRCGLSKDTKILDYGCGNGLFVTFLQSNGYAFANGFDPYIPEYAGTPLEPGSFDIVTSYDVIEHVDNPKSYLETLISLVKPGGLLVLGTPNAEEIDLFDPDGPPVELSQPYHRHILSARTLFKLAEDKALEVVDVYRRFYFDSLLPLVNTRCMWTYIRSTGGMIDAAVEPIQWGVFLKSPRLLLYAFLGYFYPPKGNILVTFRVGRSQAVPE